MVMQSATTRSAISASAEVLATWIHENAPVATATAAGPIGYVEPFDEQEALATLGATCARHNEFHTGRRLARSALALLGGSSTVISIGSGGAPIWPQGFLGTISHSDGVCVAHVGLDRDFLGIGIDIECNSSVPENISKIICRSDEGYCPAEENPLLRFVIKEAVFKAYYPATREFLEFQDVKLEIDLQRGAFTAEIMNGCPPAVDGQNVFEGKFAFLCPYIIAAIWIPATR